MSVYVDELQVWPNATGIFRAGSCHMAADTLDELHEMAAKIGMAGHCAMLACTVDQENR